jgi:signal transduction histidine kinase
MKNEKELDYRVLMAKMVNVIAHDIRNPLNNILLSTAQFKLDIPPDKDDTAFYIGIIERSCDKVNALLDEVAAVIHQPGLNPDTFDITEVVKELVQENEERLELKDMKFAVSLNVVVVARFDRAMMKQALLQVIENAIDASGKGSEIKLKVEEDNTSAIIAISDTGGGIADNIMPHIFAPFYTTRERHRGLGLTMAKNVIDAHLGSIQHLNTGTGTEVTITIPKNA